MPRGTETRKNPQLYCTALQTMLQFTNMNMNSPVEEIKSRINIVDLVGSYVRLTKAGANFKALCPFHTERTASFNVSPARQIWHCFGCSKGGDAFRFIMEIEGMDFPEALKFLAERTGVVLKRGAPCLCRGLKGYPGIFGKTTKFFGCHLRNPIAQYLRDRGLKDETIKEFRLGYASNEWRALSTYLAAKGFTAIEMEKAGLAVGRRQTRIDTQTNVDGYDRFRSRIMFPIFDYQGRAIAFGGRIFPERENEAKYINSPETILYQKSKVLYGLHVAKNDILKSGQAVVVEGYMDMIMAYQAGVRGTVASSGTALGVDQMRILRRLCDKLVMAFDMDQAGQAAADRGIQLALQSGFDITVMDLGNYKDPADAVRDDPVFFQNAVPSARHIVQFYLDSVLRTFAPDTPEGKRACERAVLPVISALSSELERAHWVRILGELLRIGEDVLWRALSRIRSGDRIDAEHESLANNQHTPSRKRLLEERLLGILASSPVLAAQHLTRINDALFAPERLEILFHLRGGATLADSTRAALGRIALEAEMTADSIADWDGEYARCYRELEKEYIKEQMGKLSVEIQRAEQESRAELPALMLKFQKLSQQLSKSHSV